MRRIGFHDPFLEILGGGEKYLLSILEEATREPGAEVTLISPKRPDPAAWERLNVHVAPGSFRWRGAPGTVAVTPRTAGLDLFVALANHVPPLSLARRSVAVVQFPFTTLGGPRGLERRARLAGYETLVCYSEFVREHVARRLRRDAVVVHPPVDTERGEPGEKAPVIAAVGRFFPAADANNKKHGVLIDAFARLHAQLGPESPWELHLAGGVHGDPASQAYLAGLREQAAGLPVAFHPNASAAELDALYRRSALFWHAAGFGEVRPERLEHFGITTAEAMAYGCVPLAPAAGGQLEIVQDGRNGRLWRSVEELVDATRALIADPAATAQLRAAAVRDAQRFSKDRFRAAVREHVLAPADALACPA